MSTLSACLIVRDEESCLETCLESIKPFVDEIVVLDTGSVDGTLEIARRLADRVEELPWSDDFSAARNAALELARGDYVLSIDADEVLDPTTGEALRRSVATGAKALLVRVESEIGSRTHVALLPRLFARQPGIRFTRPVHESVMESLIEAGVTQLEDSGVRLLHNGYRGEAANDKRERNLQLLRKRAAEVPGDLYNTYKLAVTLRASDQRDEQLSTFEAAYRAAEELGQGERATYPFLPLLYAAYGRCLVESGRLSLAATILDRGVELFPDCAEVLWRRGDLARRVGDVARACDLFGATVEHSEGIPLYPVDSFVRTVGPYLGLARMYAERGDVDSTREAVESALQIEPNDLETRCFQVRVQLAGGEAATGLQALEHLTKTEPEASAVRLLAGEVALARGDYDTAIDLWRASAMQGGESGQSARARLVLAKLSRGRLAVAEEHLGRLTDVDLESAATRLLLAVITGTAFEREPSFSVERLLERLVPLLRELLEAPAQDAAQAFAMNAPLYADALPGIEQMLVSETQQVPAPVGR